MSHFCFACTQEENASHLKLRHGSGLSNVQREKIEQMKLASKKIGESAVATSRQRNTDSNFRKDLDYGCVKHEISAAIKVNYLLFNTNKENG
ncbi:hypothetical protein GQX74_001588 [Glossina fuscipes]|nr:hypothetical protein GQX74_001588 [Glossina fuscipes]